MNREITDLAAEIRSTRRRRFDLIDTVWKGGGMKSADADSLAYHLDSLVNRLLDAIEEEVKHEESIPAREW